MAEIDPKALTLEQLNAVKEQLEKEVEAFRRSIAQLELAGSRFDASKHAVSSLAKEKEGSEMLVPLTSSLYVSGKVSNTSNVLVDIGTGYMVEMTTAKAEEFMQRKIDVVSENTNRLNAALRAKRKQLQIIMLQMSMKAAEQRAAAQQQQQQQPAQ